MLFLCPISCISAACLHAQTATCPSPSARKCHRKEHQNDFALRATKSVVVLRLMPVAL